MSKRKRRRERSFAQKCSRIYANIDWSSSDLPHFHPYNISKHAVDSTESVTDDDISV